MVSESAPPSIIVVEVLLVRETLSVPSPMLRVPAAVPLMVAESSPASALMVPEAPVLRVTESIPVPMLRLPALAAMVAVSLPEPRVTFSRFEKEMFPSLPELVPKTFSVSSEVVEVRESVPVPASRVSAVELLLTVMESLPLRVLIVSKLARALPSVLLCS